MSLLDTLWPWRDDEVEELVRFQFPGLELDSGRMPSLSEARLLLDAIERLWRVVAVAQLTAAWNHATGGVGPDERDIKSINREVYHRAQSDLRVLHMSLNSPLWLDLVVRGGGGLAITGSLVYLIKNPEKVGSWWPKVRTSYYKSKAEQVKAQRALMRLQRARVRVEAIPAGPDAYPVAVEPELHVRHKSIEQGGDGARS